MKKYAGKIGEKDSESPLAGRSVYRPWRARLSRREDIDPGLRHAVRKQSRYFISENCWSSHLHFHKYYTMRWWPASQRKLQILQEQIHLYKQVKLKPEGNLNS